jgi:hypothetical protein
VRAVPYGTTLLLATADARIRLRKVRDAVEALLHADAFDAATIEALAHRNFYADAASLLLRIVRARPGLVEAIIDSQNYAAPHRFAVAFGAVPSEQDTMELFTLDDLRAIGTPESRLALIAAGEPVTWQTMDRRARATFALRKLVHTMRDS